MNYFDHIQDYCEGLLQPLLQEQFSNELKTNLELQKAVEAYYTAKKVSEGLIELDIAKTIDQLAMTKIQSQEPKTSNKLWWILIALLSVISLVWLKFMDKKEEAKMKKEVHYAFHYQEPHWPITRGANDTIMQEAMHLFLNLDDLESAKKLIMEKSDLSPTMKNYWISEMYLKENKLDSVRKYLPIVDSNHVKFTRVQLVNKWITSK